MKKRFFTLLFLSLSITIPQVISYSKVTKNGKQNEELQGEHVVGISRSKGQESEGRSVQDIVITASPMFVNARNPILKPGEAIDYPTTKGYSTLDEEMIAKIKSLHLKKNVQDRFHPPAPFEHVLAHENANRQQNRPSSGGFSNPSALDMRPSPVGPDITFTSKPMISGTYDYPPSNFDSDGTIDSNPDLKAPTYYPTDSYLNGHQINHESSHNSYDNKKPMYGDDPPKSVDYETQFDAPPIHEGGSSGFVSNHDYHPDVIYDDHIDDDHHHYHDYHDYHKTTTTTEMPEMNDQRLSKRPYSYYYIGRKLWYIPLYFSIYFIIYIAALVLKSVARHKINFPSNLAAAAGNGRSSSNQDSEMSWWDYTVWILDAIEKYKKM
ncbi:uncharacterized protein LOC122497951 [Leptopilina heterotoma]|uniref:uncharacterized protein LOC122497951 n=1 Tax=Leptopilina heterotoma TaxID=63436 RepID=UPI001CA861A3|nr:uncharacterized protein LOC122497951 [Leptopilina heterotoma]